jgi:hypothetical protein
MSALKRGAVVFASLVFAACGDSGGAADDAGENDAGGGDGGEAAAFEAGVDAKTDAAASLAWFPGNYVLLASADGVTTERDALLANTALMASFVGLEKRYDWTACEAAKGDYSACIADVESDLAAVDAKGKKLIAFLTYKTFTAPHAVPTYMLTQGPWCNGATCGEYAMSNGVTAMIWNAGVADRLHQWIAALGAAVASSPHAAALAGIVFPESACGSCDKEPSYTPAAYVAAIEGDVNAAITAFPNVVAFQYINFLPPASTQDQYLVQLADFALATPHAGLGCPDLGSKLNLPEYPLFESAKYQGRVPLAPAVESPDYQSTATASLAATYSLGTNPAPNGMRAQIITWDDVKNTSDVFTIDDVAAYIASHPNPNTAAPTW